jgi:hypothetical protein
MVLMFPVVVLDEVITAFTYSEPGVPPTRACSSIRQAASAEMWVTQVSNVDVDGRETEGPTVVVTPAVAAVDAEPVVVTVVVAVTTGVCTGSVRVRRALNWGHVPV